MELDPHRALKSWHRVRFWVYPIARKPYHPENSRYKRISKEGALSWAIGLAELYSGALPLQLASYGQAES